MKKQFPGACRLLSRAALLCLPLAGCDSGTGPAPAPDRLEAATTAEQVAVHSTAVPVVPMVRAVTQSGKAVPGVIVTFVVSGGGTVTNTSATTGMDGVASAGSWTLGSSAGAQTLIAQANGLAPVVFTATATAGPAAQIEFVAGGGQTALTGATVAVRPTVRVRDAAGNAVAGADVAFEVESGGGTITGATAKTAIDGTASVGWTLGIEPGVQRLRARSGALTISLNATANLPVGCEVAPYVLGATITGAWQTGDCKSTGGKDGQDPADAVYDRYEVNLTSQQFFRVELTGPNGRTFRIRRRDGDYVALQSGTAFTPPTSNPMMVKYVLEPGSYILEVQAPAPGVFGDYTLKTFADSNITCRPIVFGTLGVTVTGTIDPATDCNSPGSATWFEDWLVMVLKTGDRIRLTMSTTEMAPLLVWRDDRLGPASPTLVTQRSDTPGTIVIEWTATFDGFHEAVITRANAATPWGAYTLKVERF